MPHNLTDPAHRPFRHDRLALGALLLGSALLAFGPLLVRLADTGPVASAFWRMSLAWPLLVAIAITGRRREPVAARLPLPWKAALFAGLWFAADLASWHLGIVRTTAANATLFGNMAAFLLAGWAVLLRGETLRPALVRAFVLAALGAALLLGHSADLSRQHLIGDLLCLVSACCYAAYFIVVIRLRERQSTFTVLAMTTGFTMLVLLPFALLGATGPFWPTDWRPLATLAITSQLAGQGLLTLASGRLPATLVGLGLLVQPLVAGASGWLAFGEVPGVAELAGAGLILTALVLVRR